MNSIKKKKTLKYQLLIHVTHIYARLPYHKYQYPSLHWTHVQQRIPVLSQRRRPVRVAVQQALHKAVAAALQSWAQAVAASSSKLMKSLQAQAHEELWGAAPGRTVGEATQNVIVVNTKAIQRRNLVPVPQCHAVYAIAERAEESAFDLNRACFELPDDHISSST